MLKNIESQLDYDEFKVRVARFFERENLKIFSSDYNEPYFSHNNCECCNRSLGGDRFDMIGLTNDNEQFKYEVCSDCLYYNEYGQLDDMTMLDYDLEH